MVCKKLEWYQHLCMTGGVYIIYIYKDRLTYGLSAKLSMIICKAFACLLLEWFYYDITNHKNQKSIIFFTKTKNRILSSLRRLPPPPPPEHLTSLGKMPPLERIKAEGSSVFSLQYIIITWGVFELFTITLQIYIY